MIDTKNFNDRDYNQFMDIVARLTPVVYSDMKDELRESFESPLDPISTNRKFTGLILTMAGEIFVEARRCYSECFSKEPMELF